VLQCFGAVTSDPKKMGMIVSKSFGMFDKDKSGYIEAAEAKAAAEQVRDTAAHCRPLLCATACGDDISRRTGAVACCA
jgi:hypothetical protein